MKRSGSCTCGDWQVTMILPKPLGELSPRVCDCDYCQSNPAALVSDPEMRCSFAGGGHFTATNGDELATFHYCSQCEDLLAVGATLTGELRGAVNSALFGGLDLFAEPVDIQPRLLTAKQKVARWGELWGKLSGF